MKIRRFVKIKNAHGLHARPAAVIVKLLQAFKSRVQFIYLKKNVDARSIMNILLLEAPQHSLIQIIVDGKPEDARNTMAKLLETFEMQFGE
jgi:phosphocarrier protein